MRTTYLRSIETFSYAMAKNTKVKFVDLDICINLVIISAFNYLYNLILKR